MLIMELQNYLREHKRANINDLSIRFKTSPQALEPFLEKMVRKGKLKKLERESACSEAGCCKCDIEGTMTIYQWVA